MFFQNVSEALPDPIFGLLGAFMADPRKEKVNLMVGIYKDNELRAELLNSVRLAKEIIANQDLMADYLPIDGFAEMSELLGPVVFGEALWKGTKDRIYSAHTTGGTGALRIAGELLAQELDKPIIYLPNHTWPNHKSVLERAGCKTENYPYYDREKKGFDLESMLKFLSQIPEKSVILLHACCHNPTGCDPNEDEWRRISQFMKEKKLLPFFDFAYQGLGEGIEEDALSVRIFLQEGHEMVIAYSCAKNFSMYCQRVGALFIVNPDSAVKKRVASQAKKIIRALYSNPPAHGARVVTEVLRNEELKQMWQRDLSVMRHRLNLTRKSLVQKLISGAKKASFDYLLHHKGMFSFIDMKKTQAQQMIDRFAIYLTDNGRISVAGLTTQNIDYVVNSLLEICDEQ